MATGLLPDIGDVLKNAALKFGGTLGSQYSDINNALNAGYNDLNNIRIPTPGVPSLQQIGHALYNQPTPTKPAAPSTTTTTTTGPSYQQLMDAIIQPMINNVGNTGINPNYGVAAGAGSIPYGGQGGGTVAQNISSTMQQMTNDYKGGLNAMLATSGAQQPLQSILKGMESLLSYPIGTLSGQAGAPSGVESIPFLQQLYASLNAQRSGYTPPSTSTGNNAGYNQGNVAQSVLGGG